MLEGQRLIIVSLILIWFIETFAPWLKLFTFILIFVHMIGFSLSFGPCSFLIGTEILHDITYPSMLLWIFGFLFEIITLPLMKTFGISTLIFTYFVISVIGFLYIALNLV